MWARATRPSSRHRYFRVLVDAGPPDAHVARRLHALGVTQSRCARALASTGRPCRRRCGGARPAHGRSRARLRTPDGRELRAGRARGGPPARRPRGRREDGPRASGGQGRRCACSGRGTSSPGRIRTTLPLILVAEEGDCRVLLPADAESGVELPLDLPQAGVLEVAHHGSADPGLPELLRRVRPRLAVISVGRGQQLRASRAVDSRRARVGRRTRASGPIVTARSSFVASDAETRARPTSMATCPR